MVLLTADTDLFSGVRSQIDGLLDPNIALAVTDPTQPRTPVYAEEAALLPPMRPARQREFLAGRAALREAIMNLGRPACAIPMEPDRDPQFPNGICASLSHSRHLCMAIASLERHHNALGIDIEPTTGLDADLWATVCTDRERAWLSSLAKQSRALAAKRIFCAKEAAYKCQFTLSRTLLDFDAFDVTFPAKDRFHAWFRYSVGTFAAGHRISGRIGEVSDHIVCIARIPASEPC